MNANKPEENTIPSGPYEIARRSLMLSNGDRSFVDTVDHSPELVRATVDMYFQIFIDPALERASAKAVYAR